MKEKFLVKEKADFQHKRNIIYGKCLKEKCKDDYVDGTK